MQRSKSAFNPKSKKLVKCQTNNNNKNKKQLKINTNIATHNPPITDRPVTSRNAFEERLNRIRQGFESLEKNLTYRPINQQSQQLLQIKSDLTSKKVNRKLFPSQSHKKTVTKNKQNRKQSKKKMQPLLSARLTPKNGYHSCLYQKSLLNLMKVVIVQKDEINRLNSQIHTFRRKS